MIIYPSVDVLDGQAVRLSKGDYSKVRVYNPNPNEVLRGYVRSGAKYGHIVDLNGARDPKSRQKKLLEPILKDSGLKIQIGGGVRSLEDAEQLISWGADRVVLGSAAVLNPELSCSASSRLRTPPPIWILSPESFKIGSRSFF
jgi:phosphoribosylformimino-5-aminoimidazole carboxamide ribotide isomerase